MARDRITSRTNDIMTDGGSVLLSLVQGEQLEFPVTIEFVEKATSDYTYEAVLMEALNDGEGTLPEAVQPAGVNDTLVVRLPVDRGNWDYLSAYNEGDMVYYVNDGNYYMLLSGVARIDSTTPDADPLWELHDARKVYIQFPKTLSIAGYDVSPTPTKPVYAFFELSVTEPTNAIYTKTWKPVRGLVEFLFSPTEEV
jgi:hypothetical protein